MSTEDIKIIVIIAVPYVIVGSVLIADLVKKGANSLFMSAVTSALFVGTVVTALFVRKRSGGNIQ